MLDRPTGTFKAHRGLASVASAGAAKQPPAETSDAARARARALQEELRAIWAGKDHGPGNSALGFTTAGAAAADAARHDVHAETAAPAPPSDPTTDLFGSESISPTAAAQLSALEAAALAAAADTTAHRESAQHAQQHGQSSLPSSGKRQRDEDMAEEDVSIGEGAISREKVQRVQPNAEAMALAPGPAPPIAFQTGSGRVVTVSEDKLAHAKRLLGSVTYDMTPASDIPDNKPAPPGLAASRPAGETLRVQNADVDGPSSSGHAPEKGDGMVSLPLFSTGLGGAVKVSADKLAAARSMFAGIEEPGGEDPGSPAVRQGAPVPPAKATTPADTPTLQKELLRSRLPLGSSAVGGGGSSTPVLRSSGPSRFARHAQSGSVARPGRGLGKFSTPRPLPVSRMAGVAGATGGKSSSSDGNRHRLLEGSTACVARLHDLATSKLRQALDAMPAPSESSSAPSGWARSLPLDSMEAAAYQFPGPHGDTVGSGHMLARLLVAGAKHEYATEEWVRNHYRWVVWKLARCEFAAGPAAAGRVLTEQIAEDELRRRYEREFTRGHRPLLKAILHQDVPAGGLAVLLVASVRWEKRAGSTGGTRSVAGPSAPALLELTDGWYWVMAQCDARLSQLVEQGKIYQGAKLRICGAQLAGAAPGEPLMVARTAILRLSANGTHLAPSGAKLGRQPHRTSYTPLHSIHSMGGAVPQTLVVVLRRYPQLAWSRLPSGVATFQTPRAQAAMERRLHEAMAAAEAAAEAQVREAEVKRCADWLAHGKPGGMTQGELTGRGDELLAPRRKKIGLSTCLLLTK